MAGVVLCKRASADEARAVSVPTSRHLGLILLGFFFGVLFGLPWMAQSLGGLTAIAEAFYRAGALVFGGGHVVLPLLEESVVGNGWVSEERFLAGYGASQAIPGPMFAFSAYLGAIVSSDHHALLTAAVALVFMFLPGFLLVAAVLPFWQAIASKPKAGQVIAGVNAAVVGILIAALYDPIFLTGIASRADMAIASIAFGLLVVGKRSPLWVVVWCVTASVLPVWFQ